MRSNALKLFKKNPVWRRFHKSILERSARENREGIEYAAKVLRGSPLIDWDAYAAETGCKEMGFDPAFHYVLSGEAEGYAGKDFDAAFYADRYADAGSTSANRLHHYLTHGYRDGRYTTRAQLEKPMRIVANTQGKPVVFVIDHQASRTGAPILGWNIIKALKEKYFVVSIVFNGGDLMEAFETTADVAVAVPRMEQDRTPLLDKVMAAYRPLYAVVNSVENHPVAANLIAHRVPYVTLVQEFGCFYGTEKLRDLYGGAAAIVFASSVIMEGSLQWYPFVERGRCFLQPQGRSAIPPITAEETRRKSASGRQDNIRDALRPPGAPERFVVAGLGTVDIRKGVDLFLSTATSVIRARPDLEIYFVWIGSKPKGEEHALFLLYIEEQIARAKCGGRIVLLPPTADIDTVYETIDVMYLSSRLDPMPNVCIDAAMAGTPVVCFENGTGFAEVLLAHADLKTLVVPYLDTGAAARTIEALATDKARAAALGASIKTMAEATFEMSAYVALIDDLGRRAAKADAAAA